MELSNPEPAASQSACYSSVRGQNACQLSKKPCLTHRQSGQARTRTHCQRICMRCCAAEFTLQVNFSSHTGHVCRKANDASFGACASERKTQALQQTHRIDFLSGRAPRSRSARTITETLLRRRFCLDATLSQCWEQGDVAIGQSQPHCIGCHSVYTPCSTCGRLS